MSIGETVPTTRRQADAIDHNVHYDLQVHIQRIEKVTTPRSGSQGQTTERVVTELGRINLSEKNLAWLLKKGSKAIELIGE